MKKTVVLLSFLALMFAAACPVQAQSSDPQETFQQYISDLQKKPNDTALREKIIKLSQEMKPAPAIPADAEKFGNRAEYIVKNAKSGADFSKAAKEYEKALLTAPWVPAYYYNLGAVSEKTGQLQNAVRNYKFYLLAAPNAPDTQEVRKQIDGLEYALEEKEMAEKERKKETKESMVLIPAGEFTAHPVRKLFLNAYYIDKHEVTVAQYKKFCELTGRNMPATPPWGWQDDQPVVNVSWNDATAYAQYYGKRLPTSAEWEKAARAGAKTRYSFGSSERQLAEHAWFADNSGGQPHKVGTKPPNGFGLYDMHGNAGEWCSDWYTFNNSNNDPKNPPSGQYPQFLGGSWNSAPNVCAFDAVNFLASAKEINEVGFRCASSQQ